MSHAMSKTFVIFKKHESKSLDKPDISIVESASFFFLPRKLAKSNVLYTLALIIDL